MSEEVDLYGKIFDRFSKIVSESENKEILKESSMDNLMEILNETDNELFMKNALIIIMSLINDYIPGSNEFRSKLVQELHEHEKELLKSILKGEFI